MKPSICFPQSSSLTTLVLAFIVTLLGCTGQLTPPQLITPPVSGADPAFQTLSIDNSAGGEITYKSGTVITFPKDALIDSLGNVIKGKVEIKYREFHNAAEIFLSGIPMSVEQSGVKENFQTAGMFDLRAFSKGQKVFIDPSKKVAVKLASYVTGNDYDFWKLDQNRRSWVQIDRRNADTNFAKIEKKDSIEKTKPAHPVPFDKSYFVFNYNSLLDVYFNDDYYKIRNNNDRKIPTVTQKAKKYGLDWTEIYPNRDVLFHGRWEASAMLVWKNKSEKEFPAWIENYNSDENLINSDVKKAKDGNYRLTVSLWKWDEKNRKYNTLKTHAIIIEPVMTLKSLFKFSPDYWKSQYDEAMRKISDEEEKLEYVPDAYRSFAISEFGIYNYDKFLKDPNTFFVNADFKFDRQIDTNTIMVYCLPEGDKSVIYYPKYAWHKVTIMPGTKAKFLAVLPGNLIAVFNTAKYDKINIDSLKASKNPSYTFSLQTNPQPIKNDEDLLKVLGI